MCLITNEALFWAKVDRRGDDECWPWLGYRRPGGWGVLVLVFG